MEAMGIIDFVTVIIVPIYSLWRSSKDREVIIGNTQTVVSDCKEFIEKCLRKENEKQLQEIKQYFQQECKNENAAKKVQRIIDIHKQSEESMIILNAYLKSEVFYNKVVKKLPSQ